MLGISFSISLFFIGYSNMGVRPIGIHKTYFEWTIFADPKGWVPAWIVNFYQKKFPVTFLTQLEERANNKIIPLRQILFSISLPAFVRIKSANSSTTMTI